LTRELSASRGGLRSHQVRQLAACVPVATDLRHDRRWEDKVRPRPRQRGGRGCCLLSEHCISFHSSVRNQADGQEVFRRRDVTTKARLTYLKARTLVVSSHLLLNTLSLRTSLIPARAAEQGGGQMDEMLRAEHNPAGRIIHRFLGRDGRRT